MKTDKEIIDRLGGIAKVAELLAFKKPQGSARVRHWLKRGIPAKIKLAYPHYFNRK